MQTLKEMLWCSTTRSPSTFESLLPKCISLLLGVMEVKKTFVVDQDVPFRVHSYLFTKHPLCLKNPPHRPTPVLHLRIPIYSKMHQIKPQQTIIKITNKSPFPVGDILRLHLAWTKSGILRLQSWSPAFRPTAGHHTRADLCWYHDFQHKKGATQTEAEHQHLITAEKYGLELVRNTTFPGIHFFNEGKVIEKPLPAPLRCTCGPQNPLKT